MDKHVNKNPVKIGLRLHNEDYSAAFVYLSDNQRLQDLINDERQFLPIYFSVNCSDGIHFRCVLINKNSISCLQEWNQLGSDLK